MDADDARTTVPSDAAPDGWDAEPGATEPLERLDLRDVDLMAEVTHPIRGRILRRLKEPHTVAEVAESLDAPVTRLYHHVNKLEQLGLIRVVATRRVSAVTERRYQVVARSYRIHRDMLDTMDEREKSMVFGSLFDVAKLDLQREIESGRFGTLATEERNATLSLGNLKLSSERRLELVRRLEELIEEYSSDEYDEHDAGDDGDDDTRVTLFVAAFPSTG